MLKSAIESTIHSEVGNNIEKLLSQHVVIPMPLYAVLEPTNKLTERIFNGTIFWLIRGPSDHPKLDRASSNFEGVMDNWGGMSREVVPKENSLDSSLLD
jgi:hypothetical protein